MRKSFSTAQILSVVTDKLFTDADTVKELIGHLTGANVMSVGRMAVAKAVLLKQSGRFKEMSKVSVANVDTSNYLDHLAAQVARFGAEHPVKSGGEVTFSKSEIQQMAKEASISLGGIELTFENVSRLLG